MVSRVERTPFAAWWWTIDRFSLVALGAIMLGGVVLSLAASPPVAARIGLDAFYFVHRHLMFLVPAISAMLAISFLSPRQIRRLALVVFIVSLALVVAALVLQPDFGQTMLIALVWGALFFIAGMRLIWVAGLGGAAALGLVAAYATIPHVARRIKRFLDPASGDTFQVDTAVESFFRGGWFGQGPGEGTVKRILPDSHADFVFAVAAEEFGIVLCLVLVFLFAFIVLRALRKAMRNDDPFSRFSIAGLAILFGAQSAINMAVNLALIPAKGMTLPFISYGGSSMISLAYGMGMLLAFTRERPRTALLQPPLPYPGTAGVPPALPPPRPPPQAGGGRVGEEPAGRPRSQDRVGAAGSAL